MESNEKIIHKCKKCGIELEKETDICFDCFKKEIRDKNENKMPDV